MIKTTIKQKIGLIVLSILLTLVILECGLRIGGFMFLSLQRSKNEIENDEGDVYRILALGESTTQGGIWGGSSWPSELELILNEKVPGKKFKVFNEGIGGVNTAFILSRLKGNLNKYNPNMVITMMGIDDAGLRFKYEEYHKAPLNVKLKDFRVYKLGRLLWLHWKEKINYLILKYNGVEIGKGHIIKQSEEEGKNYVALGEYYQSQGRFEEAEEMFEKAIGLGLNDFNLELYYQLEICYQKQGKFEEADEMFKKLYSYSVSSVPPSLVEASDFEISLEFTNHHYLELYRILSERGIRLVVMGYPMQSIDRLKNLFEGNKSVIFVSNEENFKEALKSGKYEDYFTDRFAGNFGHCTLKGNRLIAENVADVILKELGLMT